MDAHGCTEAVRSGFFKRKQSELTWKSEPDAAAASAKGAEGSVREIEKVLETRSSKPRQQYLVPASHRLPYMVLVPVLRTTRHATPKLSTAACGESDPAYKHASGRLSTLRRQLQGRHFAFLQHLESSFSPSPLLSSPCRGDVVHDIGRPRKHANSEKKHVERNMYVGEPGVLPESA